MGRSTVRGRCWWCGEDPLYVEYHDKEWGRPVHDDRKIFEMLLLEGFQAGLSWITILRKRENFRRAFAGFDPRKISRFGKRDLVRLLADVGIVRNRAKCEAAVNNAQRFLEVQKEFGSFDRYIWRFTGGKTMRAKIGRKLRATSPESDALSKDLKARGFKFVGSTIIYAHMQAMGMVDDHVPGCWRYKPR
jgi:DNA-3-methyladenine glycosylase I